MKIFTAFALSMMCFIGLRAQSANDDWTFHHTDIDGWFGALAEAPNGHIFAGGGAPESYFREYDNTDWSLYNEGNTGVNFFFFGRDLIVDQNGTLWLSPGNTAGLSSWDGETVTNYYTGNSGLISNSVFGVGIDHDNVLWTTTLQSFDGTTWETYDRQECFHGGMRKVFVDSDNTVWISGTYSIGIESGIVDQPCVFRIADGESTAFHFLDGDNLPEIYGGYHLIDQLPDGTLFIAGKTEDAIVMKTFDGTAWQDWVSYTGPEVGTSYWDVHVDVNGNILLGGEKEDGIAQIAKYCQGEWTFYDLPEEDSFPGVIFELLVDSQSRLWIVGANGLASVPYTPTTCLTVDVEDPVETPTTKPYLSYHEGYLSVWNLPADQSLQAISIYDPLGQQVGNYQWSGQPLFVGKLPAGTYAAQMQMREQRQSVLFVVH